MSAEMAWQPGYRLWRKQRALWFLVALNIPFIVLCPLQTITGLDHSRGRNPALVVPLGLAIGVLQLRHSLAAARGERPRDWHWTFLALVLCAYLPMHWFTWNWAATQNLVISSAAMLLRGWLRVLVIAAAILGTVGVAVEILLSTPGATPAQIVYGSLSWLVALVLFPAALYGATRLVAVADELYATRAEQAETAVGRERLRVSRDLHDLLGQSLSAISLKGDLALRLLPFDSERARAEIESLTGVARAAMHDVIAITRDEHRVSLHDEIDAAAALLEAADIRVTIEADLAEPPEHIQEVLAWAVREGTTNVLRHSDARTCVIRLSTADAGTLLEVSNDGTRAASGRGTGLTGLAKRAEVVSGLVHAAPAVIRILIAEDMHMIRGALVALLSLEEDMQVVAELDRGDRIIEAALQNKPDIAVLDIDLPGLDGLTAAGQLSEQLPDCRIIMLTGLSQPGNLLRALKAHVRGFITKDAPAQTLADGIRRVARGERVIDPELIGAALETGTSPLTAREADVLRAAESGIPTDQIATQLSLSPATVRNYLSNAISKVGARNRIDAIRISRNAGWL
jgi:two-component system response regulator DesR